MRRSPGSESRLEKLVSGGQTGVDRAALDVALACGLEVGGWCPRGRRAEDGVIDARYPLTQTPSRDYRQRTAWNVRDSDGTLVLCCGEPVGGTAYTLEKAAQFQKPCCLQRLEMGADPEAVRRWLQVHRLRVLNVAGPRESTEPGVYVAARAFLERLLS
jgi:hypothetical protein